MTFHGSSFEGLLLFPINACNDLEFGVVVLTKQRLNDTIKRLLEKIRRLIPDENNH